MSTVLRYFNNKLVPNTSKYKTRIKCQYKCQSFFKNKNNTQAEMFRAGFKISHEERLKIILCVDIYRVYLKCSILRNFYSFWSFSGLYVRQVLDTLLSSKMQSSTYTYRCLRWKTLEIISSIQTKFVKLNFVGLNDFKF